MNETDYRDIWEGSSTVTRPFDDRIVAAHIEFVEKKDKLLLDCLPEEAQGTCIVGKLHMVEDTKGNQTFYYQDRPIMAAGPIESQTRYTPNGEYKMTFTQNFWRL